MANASKVWEEKTFQFYALSVQKSEQVRILTMCSNASGSSPELAGYNELGVHRSDRLKKKKEKKKEKKKRKKKSNMSKWEEKRKELAIAAENGTALTKIDLSNLGLRDFPVEEVAPFKDTLEFLNLGGNHMSSLPESFEQFQNIKILFFAGNDFEIVPTVLGKLPSLYMLSFKGNKLKYIPEESITPSITWLILTDNQLSDLPTSIGQLSGLRKLMLTGNHFERVPAAIQNCHALQLLRISLNRLQHLPQWLLRLPNLSWLAFSGNPCCLENSSNSQNKLPIVNISQLTVGEKLGEGASSLVFKVKRDDDGTERALKLYKGAVTSDGKAEDEIYAVSLLGMHHCLLSPEAIVVGHESGNIGILLPLINTEEARNDVPSSQSCNAVYRILGYPPSFTSITRDTYPPSHLSSFARPWTLAFVLSTLSEIACVTTHLHQQGIMHGDLYAHNILVRDSNDSFDSHEVTKPAFHAILTDFGAASLKNVLVESREEYHNASGLREESQNDAKNISPWLELMEMRAFAHLIDDLLSNMMIENSPVETQVVEELRKLQITLLQQQPAPSTLSFTSFADVAATLSKLASI